MAYISTEYCYKCCKDTDFINGECRDCKLKENERAHKEHFAKLDILTLEERVRELEKQMYNLSINPPWIEPRY